MNRNCFIDYSSALVIAISGKRKRIGILLTALLFITLCPLQISTAANHEDTKISQLKGQTTANVILRSGPSRESSRLDLVSAGRFVTILETEGRWHRVRFRNKIGWLYGGFVRLQSAKLKSKSARTNTYLNLRTGPGISYKVIRRLKPATSLTIKDQTGSWLLVQAESHEGWINRNYITFEPPAVPVLVTLKDEASVTDKKVVVSKQGKQLVSAGVETKEVIADVKKLKDVVERIHSRLEASEEQRQQLSGELNSIRRNWSVQRDAIDESTRESKKIITDMAESRQEIENLKQTVTDAQTGREKLNRELSQSRQEIEKLGKHLQESLSGRKKLTTEVSALRKELESRGVAEVTSAAESKKLVTDMVQSRQEIENLKQTVTDAQTGREKLNRELSQSRQEIEKLGKHLQESLSGRKKLTTEVSALRKELESQRKLTVESAADRKNLASNLSSASGQIASLEKALKDSQDSHKKNLAEMAKIYPELESQRESTVNLESAQNMFISKLSSAIEQISKLNKELQNFQKSRNDLVVRIAKLDQELNTRPKTRVSQKKTTKKQPQKLIKTTPASKKIASRTSKKLAFNRSDAAAIDKFLRSWTDAWSRKDVGSYLSHYSLTYKPDGGMGFKKWRQQRQKCLERPAFIEVVVERVKKEMKDTGRAKVTFVQHYRSDLHTDSVTKTLDLIWEEDGWKIIKEKSKLIKLKFLGF